MRVRRVLVTCLAGAVTASALPAGAGLLPAAAAPATTAVSAPTTSNRITPVLAASLQQLRQEVNARWPNRSRASDGWLGDARHQRSYSQHNPVGHPNGPKHGTPGAVHALDITASGVDPLGLVGAILGDSRVWYIIYNRTIWSRTFGWKPRPYHGSPHTTHVHISLRSDSQRATVNAERSTRPWLGKLGSSTASMTPTQVKALQRALIARGFTIPAGPTGFFGAQTKAAVAAFQRSQGWSGSGADGVPGSVTLARLGVSAGGGSRATLAVVKPRASAPASTATAVSAGSYVPGARGAHIKAMQQALIKRGIRIPSGATGFYGNETKAAVAAFQRSQGWSGSGADGVPGKVTLARLGLSGSAAAAAPVVRTVAAKASAPAAALSGSYVPGARGAHVKAMQQALIKRGIRIPSGATGFYGNETKAAVAAFQRSQGWSGSGADGVPGKVTLARLGLR